jgi:hypothetical protein
MVCCGPPRVGLESLLTPRQSARGRPLTLRQLVRFPTEKGPFLRQLQIYNESVHDCWHSSELILKLDQSFQRILSFGDRRPRDNGPPGPSGVVIWWQTASPGYPSNKRRKGSITRDGGSGAVTASTLRDVSSRRPPAGLNVAPSYDSTRSIYPEEV